jgi:RimJ/RimL family protein N-acetyltransferase
MSTAATTEIQTERLVLAPLQVQDAIEMVGVLSDEALYGFTGGKPPSLAELEARYTAQVSGPKEGEEIWHNWIVRYPITGAAMGFLQATVVGDAADVAWVVGTAWQGQGFAKEGAAAIRRWLTASGIGRFEAHIHPDHIASQRVAIAIGLHATGKTDDEGEAIWSSDPQLS